jgi:uroporphyrinogen decarboxylase
VKKKEWDIIKKCANMEDCDSIPMALIVDSPWIPGYTGTSTIDYLTMPDKWFEANMKIKRDFPELIFLPDFWVEMGMAAEPSGFGAKISFYENKTPTVNHIISDADDIGLLADVQVPDPRKDGLMPLILNGYKNIKEKAANVGESIKIVASRGPLTIASHIMGVTEFLVALKLYPDETHKLLKITTALVKDWLQAQAEVLPEAEGILVLDDIIGFLSEEDYLEFAHPYFKDIFGSFPNCVKIHHNDTDNPVYYKYLEDLKVNIFNFTHKQKISDVRKLVGNKVCLLGNIPPLDVLAKGTPEEVRRSTKECISDYGMKNGLILSAGGGTSPGTPGENIRAMIEAAKA